MNSFSGIFDLAASPSGLSHTYFCGRHADGPSFLAYVLPEAKVSASFTQLHRRRTPRNQASQRHVQSHAAIPVTRYEQCIVRHLPRRMECDVDLVTRADLGLRVAVDQTRQTPPQRQSRLDYFISVPYYHINHSTQATEIRRFQQLGARAGETA